MIHQYINNGYHIVLDVNSGSVHVVDELVYDAIPLLEPILSGRKLDEGGELDEETREKALLSLAALRAEEEEKKEILEDLIALTRAGQLYTEDSYEEYIGEFKNRETVVKALCLHIANCSSSQSRCGGCRGNCSS